MISISNDLEDYIKPLCQEVAEHPIVEHVLRAGFIKILD